MNPEDLTDVELDPEHLAAAAEALNDWLTLVGRERFRTDRAAEVAIKTYFESRWTKILDRSAIE